MRGEASEALDPPKRAELEIYCRQFIQALQPFLQVIKFNLAPIADNSSTVQVTQGQVLEDVLERIALLLPARLADYIMKPLQKRHWSRRAAVEDVDTIIAEQLKGNYASIR